MEGQGLPGPGENCRGDGAMRQGKGVTRHQVVTQRQRRRRRRLMLWAAAPLAVAILGAVIVLTTQPGYSGFEVIGREATIVQVFLPG